MKAKRKSTVLKESEGCHITTEEICQVSKGLAEEVTKYKDLYMEEASKARKLLGSQMNLEKMKKQFEVINLITAGKTNEAIQMILTPVPFVFEVDVRMDESSRKAYTNSMLESLKQAVIKSVNGATWQTP